MKSNYQVVVAETSIVVLSKGVFQTSIPLRRWSSDDGLQWSGRLLQNHQIEWLVGQLNVALIEPSTESTMHRIHRVLADDSMPSRVPPRANRNKICELVTPKEEPTISPCLVPKPRSARRRQPRHAHLGSSSKSIAE
jgi:hypothetical protein